MATVPINVLNLNGATGGQFGIVQGRIGADIGAEVKIAADACHGLSLGIEGLVQGVLDGRAEALLVGAQIKGKAAAEAGVKVHLKLEPSPFDQLGLSLEAGAYARAHAGGSIEIYLTAEYLAEFANANLDDFTADLFLIFLEEVYAEAGVWGKIAYSAMADAYLNVVLDLKQPEPGFRLAMGYNVGLEGGTGWDWDCTAGFRDIRRALLRSSLRISDELVVQARRAEIPVPPHLGLALDLALPFVALTAYDLGATSHRKQALRKTAAEFETYIANNKDMIPNYAERRRYGERVSTGFVESTVNTVVGKRFGKRQQMRWSKQGAHLMLQTRARTLDGTLRAKFEQWYPSMKSGGNEKIAA